MATLNSQGLPPRPGHQRSKSSVLRSFMMHRRNNSQGDGLSPAPVAAGRHAASPLEETSHNRQQPQPQPQRQAQAQDQKHLMSGGAAPASSAHGNWPSDAASDAPPVGNENDAPEHASASPASPVKKPRSRSTTNLVGLLSRPKSFKNLHKMAAKDAEAEAAGGTDGEKERGRGRNRSGDRKRDKSRRNAKGARDKENRAVQPDSTASGNPLVADALTQPQVTPIYAQFCSTGKVGGKDGMAVHRQFPAADSPALAGRPWSAAAKPRPKSFHPSSATAANSPSPAGDAQSPLELLTDPSDIDAHLEALLDRRNIPEHQRYKMRSLANAIKMELIRQDWAEERSKRPQQAQQAQQAQQEQQQALPSDRPQSHGSVQSKNGNPSLADGTSPAPASAGEASPSKSSKSKHSRVKSLTLSKVTRGRSRDRGSDDSGKRPKSPGSALRKRAEGTLGRHFRSKSTESLVNAVSNAGMGSSGAASPAAGSTGTALTGFFSKAKGPQQNSPADFVTYLRTVQAPEEVEVGKLHKLRLLLRNETVAWTEDFIGQGGMEEVVGLLHRIMAVEWREEHEDALLHENLLCLKALCTTALALQYLHSIHASLLPALIHMIFDPDKKGPSEFTTRNIVTWVLFTYIQNAPAHERAARAQTVLGYLRDPERGEEERPVSFVLDMRKDRPYRVWCKEVVNVTKEVFWIFLHHLNVVSLPTAAKEQRVPPAGQASSHESPPLPPKHSAEPAALSYMLRHFPQERPPVPAAPYVGGVEWEATNYLASHLDLVNAILACTPTAAERNRLRSQMQMSGWERCMGGSLRLCKEKFYGAVHDGLRVWVAAAYEDGWNVRDVRYGPPPPPSTPSTERRSNSPKKAPAAGGLPAGESAPKLEIPKLDFVLDGEGL